ncbi:MAG: hypothetical protein ABJI96_02585 [Paracoccaceae bacterium]
MQKYLFNLPLIVSAALLLSACTSGPRDLDTGEVFKISAVPVQKFVADDSSGSGKLKPVEDFTDEEFRKTRGRLSPKKFKGVSGITSRAFVRVAESNNGKGKRGVTVKGKILEKCLHDKSLEGYYFDKRRKTVRLCVFMTTQLKNPKNGNNKVRYQYFHVEATSASVDKKNLSYPGYPNKGVFPQAFDKTKLKVSEATASGFMYKLYAWGSNIKIVNYWEANAKSSVNSPNWKKYVKGQNGTPKRIRDYFDIADRDSCIDMMFPSTVPSTLAPGDIGGIHYCLGRCDDPAIVNTR